MQPPTGATIGGQVDLSAEVFTDGAGSASIFVDGVLLHEQDVRDVHQVRALLETEGLSGEITVEVTVVDSHGEQADLSVLYVVDQPPALAWTTPDRDGLDTEGQLDVRFSVTDDGTPDEVEIRQGDDLIGTAEAPGWRTNLDLCDAEGRVELSATVVDESGNAVSADRAVNVLRPVRATLRYDAEVLQASTEIVVDVEWDEDPDFVQFLWNGDEIGRVTSISPGGCTDVPCPERCARVRYTWDTTALSEGDGELSVVFQDASGESGSDATSTRMDKDFDDDGELAEGYGGTDCDDFDDTVYSGATETCDATDNDCDGDIDEDFDGDGDGYSAGEDCPGTQDCDDSRSDAKPGGGPEVCGDGADNDCSGLDDTCRLFGRYPPTDTIDYTVDDRHVDLTDFDLDGVHELTLRTGLDVDGSRRTRTVWLEPQSGVWPDNWTETQLVRLGIGLQDTESAQVGPEIAFVGDVDGDGLGEAYVTVIEAGATDVRWFETSGAELLSVDSLSAGVELSEVAEDSAVGQWSDGTAWVAVGSFRDSVAFFELPYLPTPGAAIDQADAHVETEVNTAATVNFGPDVDGDGAGDLGISNVLVVDDLDGLVTTQDIDHATFGASQVFPVGDMNDDGYGDIVASNAIHLGQVARRGRLFDSDGWTQTTTGSAYTTITADVDGDGVPDWVLPRLEYSYVFYSDSLGGRLDLADADIWMFGGGPPLLTVPDADGNGSEGVIFQSYRDDDALWMFDGVPFY